MSLSGKGCESNYVRPGERSEDASPPKGIPESERNRSRPVQGGRWVGVWTSSLHRLVLLSSQGKGVLRTLGKLTPSYGSVYKLSGVCKVNFVCTPTRSTECGH